MIALLKILLAAAPTSKAKTDSINIMTDVLPEEMPMTVMQSMKLGIDVNRHKEIIVKAVSAITIISLCLFTSIPSFIDCITVIGISSGKTSVIMLMLSVFALLVGAAASNILSRAIIY